MSGALLAGRFGGLTLRRIGQSAASSTHTSEPMVTGPGADGGVVAAPRRSGVQAAMRKGAGGRNSFSGIVATVFGATGWSGRYVAARLGKVGCQLIFPYRCDPYCVRHLKLAGDLGQTLFFPFHLMDDDSIRKCLKYSNVVINMIGAHHHTRNFSMWETNGHGAGRIARLAKEMGVEKFIQVSALNASPAPPQFLVPGGSEFLRSKMFGSRLILVALVVFCVADFALGFKCYQGKGSAATSKNCVISTECCLTIGDVKSCAANLNGCTGPGVRKGENCNKPADAATPAKDAKTPAKDAKTTAKGVGAIMASLSLVTITLGLWDSGTQFLGEEEVRSVYPDAVIVRPARMYGEPEDQFLSTYTYYMREYFTKRHDVWKAGEETIKMPLYGPNLADGIEKCVTDPTLLGQTIEFVGPYAYTFADIHDYIFRRSYMGNRYYNFHYKRAHGYSPITQAYLNFCDWRAEFFRKRPIFSTEVLENNECVSDVLTGLPTLTDIGVRNLKVFEFQSRKFLDREYCKMGYREHAFGEATPPPMPTRVPPLYSDAALKRRQSYTRRRVYDESSVQDPSVAFA